MMQDDLHIQCQRLYDAKAAQMILYGHALGLSRTEAEDMLQETFLAVLQLETPPEQLDHYCLRVFRNRALNYRRGLFRRLVRELESRRWFENEPCDSREDLAMRRLAELPPEQREVIVLKIWHEYTFEETAALLGISPNTVSARFRYGMQKLRNDLSEIIYENDRTIGEPTANLDSPPPDSPASRQNFWPACG
jgi:RNA polymerase sigma-70 factor (ECF subfamily)